MIDLHSHILPGFDDGAQTLEDSIAMAEMALADGVRQIVATPHSIGWDVPHDRATVFEKVAQLQRELAARGIGVEILPGIEAHILPDMVRQLDEEQVFTLNGTRYMLIELPLSSYPLYTEQVIFELQIKGIMVILTHPERNAVIQQDINLLFTLVERGALAQVTAASLEGVFGAMVQRVAETMLTHNLVHVIASDAHSLSRRSPVLSRGVAAAAKAIGRERAEAMVTTIPAQILRDEDIDFEPPQRYRPKRRWFWT